MPSQQVIEGGSECVGRADDLTGDGGDQCLSGPHMVHCHTVHLARGALLSPCTVCGAGGKLRLLWMESTRCSDNDRARVSLDSGTPREE